jgi:transcription antitermination factor NusG
MYRSVRRWKDRRKELDLVLFPGYAFVEIELCSRLAVLTVPGVAHFVTFHGQPTPVCDREIQTLRSSLASGIAVFPHPYLQKGRRVRLVRGPLAGIEGILVRRKDRFRLVLSVDLIMKAVALEVDESEVEPC